MDIKLGPIAWSLSHASWQYCLVMPSIWYTLVTCINTYQMPANKQ